MVSKFIYFSFYNICVLPFLYSFPLTLVLQTVFQRKVKLDMFSSALGNEEAQSGTATGNYSEMSLVAFGEIKMAIAEATLIA